MQRQPEQVPIFYKNTMHEEKKEQELFEHHKFVVDKKQKPIRIDKYLFSYISNSTRTRIQCAAEVGSILVNGKTVKSSYKVKPEDIITIVLAYPPLEIELLPENIPIDIVYEDDDLLVINKKAGMVVHPTYGNYSGTLVNALLFYLNGKDASLKVNLDDENSVRPGLVHRLDKETSGLMIVAKNELATARLAKDMFDRKISRKYCALVWGDIKKDSETITGNIGRSLSDRKKMAVFPEGNHGKHAVTHYKVLERFGYVTLIECVLETGRTHQIRVHMKHIGHTVFGDKDYGGNKILKGTTAAKYKFFIDECFNICQRQALHAKSLSFVHPSTKKLLQFESNLPDDIQFVIKRWREYIGNR
ncbi:MAG: RluA family pseudouridine synthase [Bacteroidota bacterium]